jgi:hypothetical protein
LNNFLGNENQNHNIKPSNTASFILVDLLRRLTDGIMERKFFNE